MYMLYFFFFKQKTAYEMRISDWSSDVCSSDLAAAVLPPGKVHIGEIQGHKDARSALMAGDGKAITNAFFNAEEFKPDGIFTVADLRAAALQPVERSEEHTSELQSLMRISYAVFCLKKKKKKNINHNQNISSLTHTD